MQTDQENNRSSGFTELLAQIFRPISGMLTTNIAPNEANDEHTISSGGGADGDDTIWRDVGTPLDIESNEINDGQQNDHDHSDIANGDNNQSSVAVLATGDENNHSTQLELNQLESISRVEENSEQQSDLAHSDSANGDDAQSSIAPLSANDDNDNSMLEEFTTLFSNLSDTGNQLVSLNTTHDVNSLELDSSLHNVSDAATSNQPATDPGVLFIIGITALRLRLEALTTREELVAWCQQRGTTRPFLRIQAFVSSLADEAVHSLAQPLTAEWLAGSKHVTMLNLNKLKQELCKDHSLWERYLMPIFNSIISLFVRLETMLGVPSSWRPGLFQARPTLVETHVNNLDLENQLNHVYDQLDAQVPPAIMA